MWLLSTMTTQAFCEPRHFVGGRKTCVALRNRAREEARLQISFTAQSRGYGYCNTRKAIRHAGHSQRRVTTMAAKVTGYIKLALDAGKASPAPPVGPALGSKGVNIMAFCKEYNAQTQDKMGTVVPVEITVYEDRSFTFVLKTPPASVLLKKAAKINKGAGEPQKIVAKISRDQLKEIAEIKLPDLNAINIEGAMRIVAGTAKNMGIAIEEAQPAAQES